ncbi:Protein giant-lens [Habropoda laboriosa]|uniref:Protein giant-lens n=1 Tax=Habropoda laboriosa TaxID=597456 RepID=A0A0L7QMX5_9HYME|nr:Protein giant-lens [Habropoda laboriosa]
MADLICFLLAMFGQLLVRESKGSLLGVELDEAGEKLLNEYLSLAELQEFEDTAIELDLIDQKRKHRPAMHQQPRVLYQIGVHRNKYVDNRRNGEKRKEGDSGDEENLRKAAREFEEFNLGDRAVRRLRARSRQDDSEDELPECSDRSEVCSKVDLYGSPWVERQCRCPDGRTCPSSLYGDDGHTIVDKTRQYKLCEPVKRLPICRYFKDVTWTLAPGGGPANATVQRVYCRCRPGSVPYLVRRQAYRSSEGSPGFIYAFACSPQSRLRCQHKEPCRLFTVRKRRSSQLEEVNASPLCQCPKGHRCPRRHTDPGSLPARSYSGVLEIKTYSGYCVPSQSHHSEAVYTV